MFLRVDCIRSASVRVALGGHGIIPCSKPYGLGRPSLVLPPLTGRNGPTASESPEVQEARRPSTGCLRLAVNSGRPSRACQRQGHTDIQIFMAVHLDD